jgi:hypothetical protein
MRSRSYFQFSHNALAAFALRTSSSRVPASSSASAASSCETVSRASSSASRAVVSLS